MDFSAQIVITLGVFLIPQKSKLNSSGIIQPNQLQPITINYNQLQSITTNYNQLPHLFDHCT